MYVDKHIYISTYTYTYIYTYVDKLLLHMYIYIYAYALAVYQHMHFFVHKTRCALLKLKSTIIEIIRVEVAKTIRRSSDFRTLFINI